MLSLTACQMSADGGAPVSVEMSAIEEAERSLKSVEADIDTALVSGEIAVLEKYLAEDLIFHHGDTWVEGGEFIFDDSKVSLMKTAQSGNYTHREILESVVQLHGDTAIIRGLALGKLKRQGELLTFRTYYLRVYEWDSGDWRMLTHFTTKLLLDDRTPLDGVE